MLVTDKFTLIHMHKTGGQTLTSLISQHIKHNAIIGYHYPIAHLPEEYSQLPVIGIVRNPWDWYVSWYCFNKYSNIKNSLYTVVSDGDQADFKTTITNLVNLGSSDISSQLYRQTLISILPESLDGNQGVGLTKSCIENFSSETQGYYSWLFTRMHGDLDNANLHIGRFENLQDSFINIMDVLKVAEKNQLNAGFKTTGKLNSSKREHYSQYYDDELIKLISKKEAELIARYNYHFEKSTENQLLINTKNEFSKLSNQAKNFLLLKDNIDVSALVNEVKQIVPEIWAASNRNKRFEIHSATQSLHFIFDHNFAHYNPTYLSSYYHFIHLLQPIEKLIAEHFNHNGYIGRLIMAKLSAKGEIPAHIDTGYSLLHCLRIHIPLITADNVIFNIGGEEKNLKVGEMWEINNATVHRVNNNSNADRVHMIIDWIPNSTVREEDKIEASHLQSAIQSIQAQKIGEHQPCPCGSRKRYNECHGQMENMGRVQ